MPFHVQAALGARRATGRRVRSIETIIWWLHGFGDSTFNKTILVKSAGKRMSIIANICLFLE
jgi:hypothetical protein